MNHIVSHDTFLSLALSLLVAFILSGCTNSSPKSDKAGKPAGATVSLDNKIRVEYARGFRVAHHKNYKVLEILNPYQDRTDTLRYLLKPRATELDTVIYGAQVIEIPVRSMILTSTTHLALTDMLNANETIAGMVAADYVYNAEVRERIRSGEIVSFPQGEFNKEKAIEMDPDLVMVSAGQSSQLDDYRVLRKSGINVLVNSEWLETTPLGKAEWVKLMGLLLNREEMAGDKFSRVASRYNSLKSLVESMDNRPLVINNMPYKGAWFVSGGNSFTAQYLKDAGADYPWYDNPSTGGLRMSFEAVYEVGLRADIWINPGAAGSKEDILAKDSRLRQFKSFRNGRIYNNNRRMSPSGGNDFWESGVVHPERVLADLIHIFHPAVLPGHELYYYQKLDGNE